MSGIRVGDKLVVKAAPASIYHPMNGCTVIILGICEDDRGNKIYTFKEKDLGFGALYEHGFIRKN